MGDTHVLTVRVTRLECHPHSKERVTDLAIIGTVLTASYAQARTKNG